MKRDLFRRYVWLVDVVRHAKQITYEEISEQWMKSPLNIERSTFALRTFHNHREAIAQMFGIKILCNRSEHTYYIPDDKEGQGAMTLKIWMLQTLSFPSGIVEAPKEIESRILLDFAPEERHGLLTVMEAMKHGNTLSITYETPGQFVNAEYEVEPYCVRFWRFGWYILGRETAAGKFMMFDLSRIVSVQRLQGKFTYPKTFSPKDFFLDYYGVDIESDETPDVIRLSVGGATRDLIRVKPLHSTQREVLTDDKKSVFCLKLIPTADFEKDILAMGTDVEVLAPSTFRQRIAGKISALNSLYAE